MVSQYNHTSYYHNTLHDIPVRARTPHKLSAFEQKPNLDLGGLLMEEEW